jgi:hypothetical protein
MARNLVQEKREEENNNKLKAEDAKAVEAKKEDLQEGKIAVNQVEAVIINRIDVLTAIVMEGFKQVGVKFEEKKE